jgi:hypothetical protein
MGVWKPNAVVYYQITRLSEQKYRLAIHFAENNFGPFKHIAFVIVLFESPSKHYLECYLQACVFKFASFITLFPFLVEAQSELTELTQQEIRLKKLQNNAMSVWHKARALFMYEKYISTTSRERTHVYVRGRENILAIYLSRHIPDKI